MFRWTSTQARAKLHLCVGYRIYITPSLGNSQGKKCTATKYLTPVKLCKSLCPILWHRATVSLSLLLIASGSRVARHARQGAKVLEEDVVLYYLLWSGIKCPPSDVRHGPMIKRPPEAKDHCLKRAAGKSPDTKHCHASLTLVLLQNAVKPLEKCISALSYMQ